VITDISAQKKSEVMKQVYDEMEQRVAERTDQLNITYKKLLQSEKLAALGKLSASLAHEFNNPLFGIRNVLAGINRRVVLEATDKELVEMALAECDRIKRLIISLQDFNQPTSGVMASVDLHQLIDGILLLTETELRHKKIKLKKKYCAGKPHILGIADQLKQVFLNLLINATEGMKGAVGGTVRLSTEIFNKNWIKVFLSDTGKGIRPENMDHIFEPFFSTKPEVKGTGLGLSVSYGIIKRHGGKIEVESEPGKGSTFTVILPLETAANGKK
jgi:signal transduction histidine kinase